MRQAMRIFPAILLMIFLFPSLSFSKVAVIVNPSNPIDNLSKADLAKIFKLKMKNWPSGNKISVINLPINSPVRKQFSLIILKKGPNFMRRYYLKLVLSGKGQPPQELLSEEQVKRYISEHLNSISYITSDLVDSSVKIVTIDGKRELD